MSSEGFDSVLVNGVEWETESVEVEIEGVSGFSESDLHEGMVIKVRGSFKIAAQPARRKGSILMTTWKVRFPVQTYPAQDL